MDTKQNSIERLMVSLRHCDKAEFLDKANAIKDLITTERAKAKDEALAALGEQLRSAGATLPAPEPKGTIESSMITGLCVALSLVESLRESSSRESALNELVRHSEELGLYPASAGEMPPRETDLSKDLRKLYECLGHPHNVFDRRWLLRAADEIERYYGGMVNWKRTAEEKDVTIREYASREKASGAEIDHEALGWAWAKLEMFGVTNNTMDNALMADRFFQMMIGAGEEGGGSNAASVLSGEQE